MRKTDLEEARRNPALNNRNKHKEGISELLGWAESGEEVYATFTDIPKVGVNPQSKYDTPIGIYCYPIYDSEIIEQIENDSLPHAGAAAYINVLRANGHVVKLQGRVENDAQFQDLNMEIAMWLARRITLYDGADEKLPASRVLKLIWEKVYTYAAENAVVKTPGGIFWAFSRWAVLLERYINEEYKKGHDEDGPIMFGPADLALLCHTVHSLAKGMKGAPARWTRLFLDIGVLGVSDIADGIIHSNEPIQAVFFSPSAFKVVDRIANPRKKTDKIMVKTPADFMKMMLRVNYLDPSITVRMLQYVQDRPEGDSIWNVAGKHPYTQASETWKVVMEPTGPVDDYFAAVAAVVKRKALDDISGWVRACMYVISRMIHGGDRHVPLWMNLLMQIAPADEIKRQLEDIHLPPATIQQISAKYGLAMDQDSSTT